MTRDEQDPKATESGATDASNGHGGAGSSAGHQGAPRMVEHFSVAERAARGKAARAEVTRASHGDWEPALHRPDPVELLEEQAQTRVPELVADPLWADAGVAVHLLPGRRVPDGVRISRAGRGRASTRSSAAMPTFRTSAVSRLRTGRSCSASTTSTRPAGTGGREAARRASRWRGAIVASTRARARRRTRRSAIDHYDVADITLSNAQSLRDALNKRDEDGWELVTATFTPRDELFLIFKQDFTSTAEEPEPAVAPG